MVRILGWNINGLRSLKTKMKDFLDDFNADIICFQETKITRDMLTEELAIVEGYYSFFNFSQRRSGYSGVATYCKKSAIPFAASTSLSKLNIPDFSYEPSLLEWSPENLKCLDSEGRAVITCHQLKNDSLDEMKLCIFNVYCPRADPDRPERGTYKIDFYKLLREQSASLRSAGYHIIIIGDVNTSHRRIDHCDPDDYEEFEKREDRQFLDSFLYTQEHLNTFSSNEDSNHNNNNSLSDNNSITNAQNCLSNINENSPEKFKVVDTFRFFHPTQTEAFTCWNTKANARATNYGTRIDYVFCDLNFLSNISDSCIHPDIVGSDHCPVSIYLTDKVEFVPFDTVPSSCCKFFPEFQGLQQKLSSYFQANLAAESRPLLCSETSTDSLKRKLSDSNKTKKDSQNTKQPKVSSFFSKVNLDHSNKDTGGSSSDSKFKDSATSIINPPPNTFDEIKPLKMLPHREPSSQESKSGWKFMMRGPKAPPLCPGHKEPSVLRTVKKKGPNFNRQFYACARGVGKVGDPNAQCNFFKWS